jgi:hypothetical protein
MKRGLEDTKEGERPKKTRIGAIEAVAKDRSAGNRNGGMKGAGNRDKITPRAHKAAPKAKPEGTNHQDLTKHQAKVINGIKHELDRLHPQGEDADNGKEGGRKLRSQEASRYKSELAAYFPEYDEIIGNEEKEECKFQRQLSCITLILTITLRPVQYRHPDHRLGHQHGYAQREATTNVSCTRLRRRTIH